MKNLLGMPTFPNIMDVMDFDIEWYSQCRIAEIAMRFAEENPVKA